MLVISVPENQGVEIRDREGNVLRIRLRHVRIAHPNKRADLVFDDEDRNFEIERTDFPAAASK